MLVTLDVRLDGAKTVAELPMSGLSNADNCWLTWGIDEVVRGSADGAEVLITTPNLDVSAEATQAALAAVCAALLDPNS